MGFVCVCVYPYIYVYMWTARSRTFFILMEKAYWIVLKVCTHVGIYMVYGRRQKDSFKTIRNYDFTFTAFIFLWTSISEDLLAESVSFFPPSQTHLSVVRWMRYPALPRCVKWAGIKNWRKQVPWLSLQPFSAAAWKEKCRLCWSFEKWLSLETHCLLARAEFMALFEWWVQLESFSCYAH